MFFLIAEIYEKPLILHSEGRQGRMQPISINYIVFLKTVFLPVTEKINLATPEPEVHLLTAAWQMSHMNRKGKNKTKQNTQKST